MSAAVIVVAHDDPNQRKLIDMLLSADEPEFIMCEDGRQVLEYLRDHTPDLAILDAKLPLVSGIDICNKIKSIRRLAEVPVVLTVPPRNEPSTHELRERAGRVRADLVLPQPLGDKNLRERVNALLGPGPASRHAPSPFTTQIIEQMLDAPKLHGARRGTLADRVRELEAENQALRDELDELHRQLEEQKNNRPRGLFGFFRG